ncbi:zinc-binding dehydrogenase [Streptosporangium algeriense]|uniref:Zinc-binding dehydrogenase n=1 Tax=Streptosporangium algeriense TaxID=1682748 RepID=A0ABW3DQP1_9ACTN
MMRTREVHLAAKGRLEIVEAVLETPGPGQVLVRNRMIGLRAAMGLLLTGGAPGMPAYQAGKALWGPAVGEVVAGELPPGTLVAHPLGWREHAVLDTARVRVLPAGVDPVLGLAQAELAHAALTTAELSAGETVFVSSAAGSIGSVVGTLARRLGSGRVVGSASAGKLSWLTGQAGFDAAFDRAEADLVTALHRAAPEGVDVYLDLTGGAQTQAVIEVANPGARIMAIGTLDSHRNQAEIDLTTLITKRITLRGFTLRDHPTALKRAEREIGAWSRRGLLAVPHTAFHGLEQAGAALAGLLDGAHTGTVVVKL